MFNGFTDGTFEFYMAIRFNNNRDFFAANRDRYQSAVREPMLELCAALGGTVREIDPGLDVRPEKCVARVNRDVRFSRDKSPYRDYSFMKFRQMGVDRYETLGFYFDLSDAGASFGLGIYHQNLPMMRALSRAIAAEPDRVRAALRPALGHFTPHADVIKRMKVPDAIPEDLKSWYPLRGFYLEREIHDFDLIKSPRLADEIARGYRLAAPMYQLLTGLEEKEIL